MKTLLLIRHAKSSWNSDASNDFDRPLNDRGKTYAPEMAKRLIKRNIDIDAFISSPAKRAKKTAELFMNEYGRKSDEIILIPELYHASPEDFYNTIEQVNDKYKTVAIFSHNPGITEFVNELIDRIAINDMPTCSIFTASVNINSWNEFRQSKKEFLFFDYPKNN